MSQVEMAGLGGVSKMTQLNYEKDVRSPDAAYLAAVAERGVDVLFVVVGVRAAAADLTPDETRLVEAFAAADSDAQRAALLVLEALAQHEPRSQAQPSSPTAPQRNWEVRPDIDLSLWRSVALSLPGSVNAGNVSMTPQQWLEVVNSVYESAKADKAARDAAERGARSALSRAQQK